jgi:cholest-4-en-3-one 26-monooxygenase
VTQTTTPEVGGFNLADADLFLQGPPHAIWRRLRRDAPVYWTPAGVYPGFWSVTTYEGVLHVSRDPATFQSEKGITMFDDPDVPDLSRGRMMITTDPPRHVRLRRLVNKAFTPRMVATLEPHIREITTAILDDVTPKGRCDFVVDVAARLPLAVICEMMGVPSQDWDLMFRLTNMVLGSDDPEYQQAGQNGDQTAIAGSMQMFNYFAQQLQQRRAQRREDLVSVLVDADIDGEQLTDEEILFFCFLLIIAGNETTRNAISGGLLALVEHPEQFAKLRARPELLPSAIEEILRWTSPVMHMARHATRDTAILGQPIKQGEKVLMWYPSANRDEAAFADPDVFDIERTPNEHLAFGIGEHFCLGAGLARLELRVMFEEVLRRLADVHLAGPVERLRSTFIAGIKHMPVSYTAVS